MIAQVAASTHPDAGDEHDGPTSRAERRALRYRRAALDHITRDVERGAASTWSTAGRGHAQRGRRGNR